MAKTLKTSAKKAVRKTNAKRPTKSATKATQSKPPLSRPSRTVGVPKAKVAKQTVTKSTDYGLAVGDPAPAFQLPSTSGQNVKLGDLRGGIVVLYFYPRDNTPGCTLESHDFSARHARFRQAGASIFGVSTDSIKSHLSFKTKCGFPFDLLSDESTETTRAFGVMQMKSMYGKSFEGIERSTFIVDAKGMIRAEWRKVKVPGHADEVLARVEALAAEHAED